MGCTRSSLVSLMQYVAINFKILPCSCQEAKPKYPLSLDPTNLFLALTPSCLQGALFIWEKYFFSNHILSVGLGFRE